jgi:hypothetical protein
MLNLGGDYIYIANIRKNKKFRIIKTFNNKIFNCIVKKLNSNFDMEMKKISDKSNSFILEISKDSKVFLVIPIPIKEECKLNCWIKFKQFGLK